MSQDVTGKIYQINETQQVTEKFSKREFVLELSNNPAYVEKVIFTLMKDKVDLIDGYSVGDTITVKYNLKGRDWTSPQGDVKFFNTLEAWSISSSSEVDSEPKNDDDLKSVVNSESHSDDLPF
tara:strand:- start:410 stop:778 length:369 start_codon:yes stop_codon:yes gene_type:complete